MDTETEKVVERQRARRARFEDRHISIQQAGRGAGYHRLREGGGEAEAEEGAADAEEPEDQAAPHAEPTAGCQAFRGQRRSPIARLFRGSHRRGGAGSGRMHRVASSAQMKDPTNCVQK